jgi:N-acetylglucosaminyldiphosphoundecaprenol N-acetyl-beta-D-mannosaminyltransferase
VKKKTVLTSSISVGTYPEFIREIFSLVQFKTPSYVCLANVHMVVEGYHDRAFQKIVNKANIVAPDGKPIALFVTYLSKIKQDRVCGMDLLPDILKHAEASGKSVYFFGTTDELLATIVQKAEKEFPSLKISGYFSPPFRDLSEEENARCIEKITSTSPDLVFVSLGCPKQEKWMARNRDKIGACLLGVGQAFKVYAGVEKRLPKWMRDLSLEWMYRLYTEPRRLWKRYLYTNSIFLYLTLRYMIARFIREVSVSLAKARPGNTTPKQTARV